MTVEKFWEWALARYGCTESQQLLLRLQHEGDLVILEALFAGWLAHCGQRWQASDVGFMHGVTASWMDEVVLPLRMTREKWKSDPDRQQQRSLLLQLEVQAERHLADLIWFALLESHRLSQAHSESVRPDEVSQLMAENLSVLPIFRRGEYVSEREQLVALLCEAT